MLQRKLNVNIENISYIHASLQQQNVYKTLPSLLDKRASEMPEKAAHIFRNLDVGYPLESRTVLAFADLASKSLNVAAYLENLGVKRGDTFAILGLNCPEWLYVSNACLRLGVLMLGLPNNLLHPDILQEVLHKHNVKGLILDVCLVSKSLEDADPGLTSGDVDLLRKDGYSCIEHIFYLNQSPAKSNCISVQDMIQNTTDTSDMTSQLSLDPDDIAVVFPTSGSTGQPKFATYSHFSVINTTTQFGKHILQIEKEDLVYASDRPFSWFGGNPYLATILGVTVVHAQSQHDMNTSLMKLLFEIWDEEIVTDAFCLPYMINMMMVNMPKDDIQFPKSFGNIFTGGDAPPEGVVSFCAHNHIRVSLGYGGTEIGIGLYSVVLPSESQKSDADLCQMKLVPGNEAKVVRENNQIVQMDEVGKLLWRSYFAMVGYLNDAEMTSKIKPKNGWIETGDVAKISKNGYIQILGRTNDIISRGSTKVFPQTIEKLISKYPKVKQVVVIGLPDPVLLNEICACVIPEEKTSLTESELKTFCEENAIGHDSMLIPHYYYFLEQFPRGATGKYDRKALSRKAIEHFAL